ncbi:MAG: penicillin acylase family protein [Gammaproteobacteria bacterium]|nr:penicillin acylase family protein [Gammaproteobacteria bacterium]
MTQRTRILLYTLGALSIAALAVSVVAYKTIRASLPMLDGEIMLAGLRSPVEVARDGNGVPTIKAYNRIDLARATGFVHAQDRFFQMDLLRRAPGGELSELFGAAAIEYDKGNRRHRFRETAKQVFSEVSEIDRQILRAYAEGVNSGLQVLGAKPPEYFLLGVEPRAWEPVDTLMTVYAMYFDLQDEEGLREKQLGLLHASLPEDVFKFLAQTASEWDAPLSGDPATVAPLPSPHSYDLRSFPDTVFDDAQAATFFANEDVFIGSNNWAVHGDVSRSGGAIVSNDMHLGHGVPNIWYRMRLQITTPEDSQPILDMTGVTLPGTPILVAGSNRNIAWGFTNSYGDWVDIVELELDPDNPDRYRTPQGYKLFDIHEEVIRVKGGQDEVAQIPWTIWGPVIGENSDDQLYAVQWVAHKPEGVDLGLRSLEEATSVQEALDIATITGMPAQNFVVGDRAGNIGWTIIGRIPVRGDYESALPVSWSEADWRGWRSGDEYPRVYNPRNKRIWTANARVVDEDGLKIVGDGGYALGARAGQIRDGLFARDDFSEADMLAIQLDDRALFLERWRVYLLSLLTQEALEGRPLRQQARQFIEEWGGRAAVDSVGYRIVRAFRSRFRDDVLNILLAPALSADKDFMLEEGFSFGGAFTQVEAALWQLLSVQPAHLLNPNYSSWSEQALQSLDAALADFTRNGARLSERTWGERNTVRVQHPIAQAVPMLGAWLNMPDRQLPGDTKMPRVQSPGFGASERFSVSPGNEEHGYFHMPAGQSGHFLSPFYHAGHSAWESGELTPFLPGETAHNLFLAPALDN